MQTVGGLVPILRLEILGPVIKPVICQRWYYRGNTIGAQKTAKNGGYVLPG